MRSIFTLLFIILATAVWAQPKASIDHPKYDFGTFKEGADSTHVFIVKNTGDRPLVIFSVSKPCGCTSPTFSKAPIKPGETGTVIVKYKSADHPGFFSKTLQVRTNDPKQDVVTITISGTVTPKKTE